MSAASDDSPRNGRIVTFYSYKGGTGRSMALANVAWIIASAGKRVLVIDWDFEAPGLHRYLHPFLADPELASTRGLIDYFVDVSAAARSAAQTMTADLSTSNDGEPWWSSWCTLARYTIPIDWSFELGGVLDFVPAGQQCSSYAVRVSSMDWHEFYDQLGGGVLLEALKEQLRADYDYVLIDSRTGISDTASICTVQMPDELVVFFTLNAQSMKGAAAVAESAWSQRVKASGAPGLKVWPVPTRVEMAEKERLDAAKRKAHSTFLRFIELTRVDRLRYWESVEVLYYPFYAYEEVLAPFAEGTSSHSSMLRPMEALTSYITGGEVKTFPRLSETERTRTLARFVTGAAAAAPSSKRKRQIYVSYSIEDQNDVHRLIEDLNALDIDTWSDRNVLLGDKWDETLLSALLASSFMLFVVPRSQMHENQARELTRAARADKRIVPVLIDMPFSNLPSALAGRQAVRIERRSWKKDVRSLAQQLKIALDATEGGRAPIDASDPQKGQWGGLAKRNGRELTATVKSVGDKWFEVRLEVRALPSSPPLTGAVKFHLHPTFQTSVISVAPVDGVATVTVVAWGAFTVGAAADGGETPLELDLAADSSLPKAFRER
jgi:CO dehydrogenase nickel-insertion accessory protein CooC1